jgi:glycosyltransferase involved in cell wall biosynthesis
MSIPKISVVICTHNPRLHYLTRVLEALKAQTIPCDQWELLLIDNKSKVELVEAVDLSWHPLGRHVLEDELGLTPARLRGIAESQGEVIVFVDDDNVLESDYLAEALRIGRNHPFLGTWGAGSIEAEFETQPQPWINAYLDAIAVRRVDGVRWSNDVNDSLATPLGAGICIRRIVAQRYSEDVQRSKSRRELDRVGTSLRGGGDLDLALTSRHFDLGWGNFPTLKLIHLIPEFRTTESYMINIVEAGNESLVLLLREVGGRMIQSQPYFTRLIRAALIAARQGTIDMRLFLARQRGIDRGRKLYLSADSKSIPDN